MEAIIRTFFIILIFTVSSSYAFACEHEEIDCGPFTNWYDVNWLDMTMKDGQGRGDAHWVISIDKDNNDSIIEKDENYDGNKVNGTLIIVSGRIMLTKGLDLKEGYEIDAADGPGLMMQLLLNVLGYVAPGGPDSIKGKIDVNHKDEEHPIKVTTSSASGVFGTPWVAKGFLEKKKNNIINYNIHFESTINKNDKYTIEMKGQWANKELDSLQDNMSIEGWKIYTIGPYSKKFKDGTIFDYGAQIKEGKYNTLGMLRDEIQRMETAPNKAPKPTPIFDE